MGAGFASHWVKKRYLVEWRQRVLSIDEVLVDGVSVARSDFLDERLYRESISFSLGNSGVSTKFNVTVKKRAFYRGLASFELSAAGRTAYKEP